MAPHTALARAILASYPDVAVRRVVYGKYYAPKPLLPTEPADEDQAYYVFTPAQQWRGVGGASSAGGALLPAVLEFHGGGFVGGLPTANATADVAALVRAGVAWVSFGYRLVTTRYLYLPSEGAAPLEEEFIHAAADGSLQLDRGGRVLSDYEVRVGRQEFNTKCSYDAAVAVEHFAASAAGEFGIDAHSVALTGGSAGGGEMHYLAFTHHRNNSHLYTPLGIAYTMAQLDYTVENTVGTVWDIWAERVGRDTRLAQLMTAKGCGYSLVGNPWCVADPPPVVTAQTPVCNKAYHEWATSTFCTPGANASVTVGQAQDLLTWPPRNGPPATEHERGIARLWQAREAMADYAPPGLSLYVKNWLNSTTDDMAFVHSAAYALAYAEAASKAGVEHVALYADYPAMRLADRSDKRFVASEPAVPGEPVRQVTYNYRASWDWESTPAAKAVGRGGPKEQYYWMCDRLLGTGAERCATLYANGAESGAASSRALLSSAAPVSVAYLPEWRLPGANYAALARHTTHVLFFSAEPSPDGGILASDRLPSRAVVNEARDAAVEAGISPPKLLACFGGNGRSAGFAAMSTRKKARRRFVQNVQKLVNNLGLDGVDYNWEYPGYAFGRGYAPDAAVAAEYDGLAALVRETRAALGAEATITAAYYPDGRQERELSSRRVHESVDLLHAMSYDAVGPQGHSSMELLTGALDKAQAASLPLSKVTLGLPFYGRGSRSGEWTSYEDLVQRHHPLDPGADEVRDGERGEVVHFNGAATIEAKCRAALAGGAAGVMLWEAGQDCRTQAVTREGQTHGVTCPRGEASSLLAAVSRGLGTTGDRSELR